MKKIFYSCLMLATTLLVACSPEQDEIFEKSAAERIAANIEKIEQTLESSPNGWQFELFTGTGGTNVMVKFADGKVTASDYLVHGSDVMNESLYSVVQNGGPVLTFDTYNDVFHAYSDPKAPGEPVGDDEGLGADFEFVVESCTDDLIILRGLKHQRLCRMTRQTETDEWGVTLDALQAMNATLIAPSYEIYYDDMMVGGTSLISDNELITYRVVSVTEEELTEDPEATDKLAQFSVAIVPTLEGFRTEEPFSYDEDDANPTIQNFTYDVTLDRFVCQDAGINMYIQKVYPPINEVFVTTGNMWQFAFSFADGAVFQGMSSEFETLLTNFNNSDCVPYGERLEYAFLGTNTSYPSSDTNQFAFSFFSKYSGGLWKSIFGYTCTIVDGTVNQVSFSTIKPTLNAAYYPGGNAIAEFFVNNSPWVLTSDDNKAPTQIQFASVADSNIYLTVIKY